MQGPRCWSPTVINCCHLQVIIFYSLCTAGMTPACQQSLGTIPEQAQIRRLPYFFSSRGCWLISFQAMKESIKKKPHTDKERFWAWLRMRKWRKRGGKREKLQWIWAWLILVPEHGGGGLHKRHRNVSEETETRRNFSSALVLVEPQDSKASSKTVRSPVMLRPGCCFSIYAWAIIFRIMLEQRGITGGSFTRASVCRGCYWSSTRYISKVQFVYEETKRRGRSFLLHNYSNFLVDQTSYFWIL